MICKKKSATRFPNDFLDENNKKTTKMKDIANGIKFVAYVCPKLADKFEKSDGNQSTCDYLRTSANDTLFCRQLLQKK